MSDGKAPLLPHACRRLNRRGAVCRSATSLHVCRDLAICCSTPSTVESTTASRRVAWREQSGRSRDQGLNLIV
jgi:hypothetical protein